MRALVASLLLLALALSVSLSRAQLFYEYEGREESIKLTQLWYEGYWQKITSINGTITWDTKGDLNGKIVVSAVRGPHESDIRAFHRKGAIAAIFIRPGTFLPGFGMYIVDGHSRSDLALPTMEATYTKDKHILKLPEGSFVRCLPTENLHKKANDTKFQLIMNLVQSFWELAIIFIACYRIYQFYIDLHSPIFSVAPLCCTLEGIAAALRLVYTVVDPFYTYRILDNTTSIVMVTVSWPFSEAAGILLTFFWAETLLQSNIKALPFISQYKWLSISVIVLLFALEISMSVIRAVLPNSLLPIYLTCIVSFIVQIVLVVCYLTAAVAIARRIGSRGKKVIRRMTIRIAVSCIGYFICIASIVSFAVAYQHLWGRAMTLNSVFIGLNLAGIMQVLALKPAPQHARSSKSNSHHGSSKQPASRGADSSKGPGSYSMGSDA